MTQQSYKNSFLETTDNSTDKQNICLAVVKICLNSRQTKALACYYLLKQFFKNSLIYDYQSRMFELAARLRISHMTLYNYFDYLRSLGLIQPRGKHLLLISTTRVKKQYRERKKYQISISESESLETVEARFFAKILEQHARRIEFHKRIKRYERKYTRTRNTFKKRCHEPGPGYSLSIRNLQKTFNLGRNKTIRAILLLNDLGVIHTTKSKPYRAGKAPQQAANSMDGLPGHYFVRGGVMYIQFGNKHELLEHTPNPKDLTYKQYALILRNLKKTAQH